MMDSSNAALRRHDLDNLRALAMLAGVVFHAGLAYSPMLHPVFPTADRSNSAAVDAALWLMHLVRMPLFFVVAGYFTTWLVERRGAAGTFRNRVRRILLPLIVFGPLVQLALVETTWAAAAHAAHPSPVLAWIREQQLAGSSPPLPLGTGHLWFLYYLLWLYLVAWCAATLGSGWWQRRRLASRIASLPRSIWLLIVPLALAPSFAAVTAPHPAPDSLLPQFWALGLFGPFFAWGALLRSRPELEARFRGLAPSLVAGSLLLYLGWFGLVWERTPELAIEPSSWPVAILGAYISVWMTAAGLDLGRRWLDRPNALLRWLADASYWTYIVHLPVLFAIQYALMDVDWIWPLEFGAAVASTFAICLLGYECLARRGPLARLVG